MSTRPNRPTVLLFNLRSRKSQQIKKEVLGAFAELNINIDEIITLRSGNKLGEALTKSVRMKPRCIIICGGDGTISYVMNRLMTMDINVGIIPGGTTNNIARSLDIPFEPQLAAKVIKVSSAKSIDIGELNSNLFTNVASVGVSAHIASNITPRMKRRLGRFAYALQGMVQILSHRPFSVTIHDKNKNLEVNFVTHQLIIANGKFHGGKVIAENHSIDDGQLVIFPIGGRSRISLAVGLVKFYASSRKKLTQPSYFIGRDILVSFNRPQYVEIDGEVKNKKEKTLAVQIKSSAIKVHRP